MTNPRSTFETSYSANLFGNEMKDESEKVDNKEKVSKHRPSYFTPKIKFTPDEDILLLNVVQSLGIGDWHVIASRIPGRNARQCRERWNNYVNPSLKSSPWTAEEDKFLLEKYQELGPHWHTIASFFMSRSTNSIKNRFTILQRRQKKKCGRKNKEKISNSRNDTFDSHQYSRKNSFSIASKSSLVQNEKNLDINQEKEYFINSEVETKKENEEISVQEKENKDPLHFLEFLKDSDEIFWSTDFDSLSFDWFGANYM